MKDEIDSSAELMFCRLREKMTIAESLIEMRDKKFGVWAVLKCIAIVENISIRDARKIIDEFKDWQRL